MSASVTRCQAVYPLILFAPGGMSSVAQMWKERPGAPGEPLPWMDPTVALSDQFTVIALDVRNAGGSRGPVTPADGWSTYASDHWALLDQLGVDRTHAMGGCIGSSHVLAFMQAQPDRVTASVLQNPIGLSSDNRDKFIIMFEEWAAHIRSRRSDVTDEALASFCQNLFGGEFVFSVDRDFVRATTTPLLVLAGNDDFHPTAVAEEVASLSPNARLAFRWAGPARHAETAELVRRFLVEHTPAA